jgi:hypothetical protein
MAAKSKRTDRRSKSVLLPSEETLNSAREQLPFFEPYDIRALLADAARANNGIASDAAITAAYNQHFRTQLVQLLRALGCDQKDKQFWPKALVKLAMLHHNLGRLAHSPHAEMPKPGQRRMSSSCFLGVCDGANRPNRAGGGPNNRRRKSFPALRATILATAIRSGYAKCAPSGSLAQVSANAGAIKGTCLVSPPAWHRGDRFRDVSDRTWPTRTFDGLMVTRRARAKGHFCKSPNA